jgi:hypothetical protein
LHHGEDVSSGRTPRAPTKAAAAYSCSPQPPMNRSTAGDRESLEDLIAAVYAELERTAGAQMRARYGPEPAGPTRVMLNA